MQTVNSSENYAGKLIQTEKNDMEREKHEWLIVCVSTSMNDFIKII